MWTIDNRIPYKNWKCFGELVSDFCQNTETQILHQIHFRHVFIVKVLEMNYYLAQFEQNLLKQSSKQLMGLKYGANTNK